MIFVQGNELLFETKGQPVPDSVKVKDMLKVKVTDVDDTAKAAIL